MYSITVIRINATTKVFENTETHTLMLVGQAERELLSYNPDSEQIQVFESMNKSDVKTIQIERSGKIWFIYLTKIN